MAEDMRTLWPQIIPDAECFWCREIADCVAFSDHPVHGRLCGRCGRDDIDQQWWGQYLIWKELRAIRTLLEHPVQVMP